MIKHAVSGVFSSIVGAPWGEPAGEPFGGPFGGPSCVVGHVRGANPLPLTVPCQRATATPSLGGFLHHASFSRAAAGFHVGVKRPLLAHESVAGY